MPWPRRKLLTLLDVGLIAGGGGPIEPPIGDMDGLGVWYRADHGLYTNTAAQFAAVNAEQLTITINPSLVTGPGAWTWGGWMWLDSAPVAEVMSAGVWRMYTDGSFVRATVTGTAYVEAFTPAVPVGTWQFLVAGYRPESSGQVYILANNVQAGLWLAGGVGAVPPTSGPMHFGNGFSGRLQGWFQFNRELTATERTFLYNAGAGRRFDELDAAFKTGLQGWWPMNEASGSRRDLSGNNNTLTDVNTVLSAPGKVPDQAASGPVGYWQDSGPNHFDLTQPTAIGQPLLVSNARNSRSVVRFDGVNDYMQTASILGSYLAGAQAQTVFVVQKQLSTDGQSITYRWDSSGADTNVIGALLSWSNGYLVYDTGAVGGAGDGRMVAVRPEPWQDTWHITEMVRDGVTGSFTIEGNAVAGATQPTGIFGTTGSSILSVGTDSTGTLSNCFQGDIAELIIFNRVLTTGERDTVRNYLKLKWGIAQNKLVISNTPASYGYLGINSTTNDRLAIN